MPELPEVETIARALAQGGRGGPALVGRRIRGARLLWARTLATPSPRRFHARIRGQAIRAVSRRGKFLCLHLDRDELIFHLRMTGDLVALAPADSPPSFCRLLLLCDDGTRLAFDDARKFGRAWLVADDREVLGGLGPEPLDPRYRPEHLYRGLKERRRQLKPLLLDQSFLAGLGNIYTDESLHRAGLHPLTPSDAVTRAQAALLWQSIRRTLRKGIRRNGTSIDWAYRGGDFQTQLRAYGRTGSPCPVCGVPIERLLVGQRGTHICPRCQPLPQAECS
jgi:formamidopyrimidine-DNA glycosylase